MNLSLKSVAALLVLGTCTLAAFAQAPLLGGPKVETTYHIGGRVVDSSGKPAGNVRVCAFADDFDASKPNVIVPCGFSNKDGLFTIGILKTGTYRLIYNGTDQGYWSPYLPFFRSPTAPIPEVVVDDTTLRGPIQVSLLPKNGLLVGKSIDVKTGLPIETVEFVLCHVANPQTCRVVVVKNAEGNFMVPAPHVPFTLRAKASGFEEWSGLSGENSVIYITAESTVTLNLLLKRQADATDRPISETEKQPGLNLPAPVQLSPEDGVVFDHYPRKTKLEWAPVESAVSYSVEIDYCKGGRREGCVSPNPLLLPSYPPQTGIKGTTYEFGFVGAQPGRWRVWAVDRDGREGFKSPWRTFIYLL